MYYAIDVDTRTVECMHEDGDVLAKYVLDNNLQAAVFIIGEEDDLILEFTLPAISEIHENINGEKLPEHISDNDAMVACWDALEDNQCKFPIYTPKLAKQLLKAAEKRNKDSVNTTTTKPGKSPSAPKKSSGTRLTTKTMAGKLFINTDKKAREGTAMAIIQSAIDDGMGEATFEEIREAFMFEKDCDEKYANGYISGSVREGFTEINLGE